MKLYSLALFFTKKEDYDKWLANTLKDAIKYKVSGTYPFQEILLLTTGYGDGVEVYEEWRCYKYSTDRPTCEYMCGAELYYFELLDGFYRGEDIMYLMSRMRMGVMDVVDHLL